MIFVCMPGMLLANIEQGGAERRAGRTSDRVAVARTVRGGAVLVRRVDVHGTGGATS